jgi:hypothetical protein
MMIRGRVKDGVVILPEGVALPEGQEVLVSPVFPQGSHSVLDIPAVDCGPMLRPLTSDDDILGEMLEGRFGKP